MKTLKTVMIVDDEPNVRLVFRTTLESSGYRVDEAKDGEEALEKLANNEVDLVLLDLQMPRLDGSTTLKRLRDAGSNVPVVIVTAHGSVPDAVAAMRLGAIDFLSKPLTPDTLRKVVAEVVERHAQPKTATLPQAPVATATAMQFIEHMKMAKLALGRRSFAEGEFYLKQAIALKPNSAEAHNLMGIMHELRDEHDASYREYRAAIKADRNFEPAKNNLTRYYERFTYGRTEVPLDAGDP